MDQRNIKTIKKILANRNNAPRFLDQLLKNSYKGKGDWAKTASLDIDHMYE